MNGWNDQIAMAVAAGEGLILLILLIWIAKLTSSLRKQKQAYAKLIGDTGVPQLEDVLRAVHGKLDDLDQRQKDQETALATQEKRLSALKGKIGVHRFNAFSDTGSDLSFSIAIVNDEQDGVVITGIHSREQAFLYAKPIDKGQSAYMLSPEEKTAINRALHKE